MLISNKYLLSVSLIALNMFLFYFSEFYHIKLPDESFIFY